MPIQGDPGLLVFTFLEGSICNLLQADQLVPSIKGICKTVRRTSEGLHSQGSLGERLQEGRAEPMLWSEPSGQLADGKGFLIHPFGLEKQMPREMVKFPPWERFPFEPTSLLGVFCGKQSNKARTWIAVEWVLSIPWAY